ncbi:MAG: hypothetical protein ACPGQL_01170 [Thermoplasmatota archaeon]
MAWPSLKSDGHVAGLEAPVFRYTESELDPAVNAEILTESSRAEARIAVLEILLAIGFGVWLGFGSDAFAAVALFTLATVVPLLVDSGARRRAASKLRLDA